MRLNRLRPVLFVFASFLIALIAGGCSSIDTGSGDSADFKAQKGPVGFTVKIESDPSGADVFAMGERIGMTPMVISSRDIFPSDYPKEKEIFYGKVTLKKTGCSDLTKTVDKKLLVMRAQLECGHPSSVGAEKPRIAPDAGGSAEQRLTRIKELLDKGLITEDEAKRARERIINEL